MPHIIFMYNITIHSWDKNDYIACLKSINTKVGAEIGVYNGEFSNLLLKNIPDLKLYLIDPYKEYIDPGVTDCQRIHDARYEYIKELFKDKNVVIIRKTSQDALSQVNEPLDFVYIDGDHSKESVEFDIANWDKKVRLDGIVSGHDFDMLHSAVINAVLKCSTKPIYLFNADKIWVYRKENRQCR